MLLGPPLRGHAPPPMLGVGTLGRFVRKGEKGIAILAPILRRRPEDTKEDESRVIVGFRAAYVFDVEQTDGAPLPQAAEATGDPGEHIAALKSAIAAHGILLEYADGKHADSLKKIAPQIEAGNFTPLPGFRGRFRPFGSAITRCLSTFKNSLTKNSLSSRLTHTIPQFA